MKLVINSCYGGFGVSEAGWRRYAELKNIPLFVERDPRWHMIVHYWIVPPEQRTGILSSDEFHAASLEDRKASNARYRELQIEPRDIPRNDATLVQVVEELGALADGRCASLCVVEIPDDVKWQIDEYDGYESIHEVHRSWP
jgi:hypothetical protein